MSLCFRVLPSRLSSLVSSRKPLSKLNRHELRKHVESFAFLEQFLGTQRALSIRTNVTGKTTVPSMIYAFHQNLLLASPDVCNKQKEKPIVRYDAEEIHRDTTHWTHRSHRLQRLNIVVAKNRKHIAATGLTSDDIPVFQMQNVENDNNSFLDNSRIVIPISENSYSSPESSIKGSLLLADDATTLKASQQSSPSPPPPHDNEGKPSQEQLQSILDRLGQELPKLFVKHLDYTIYTEDITFINNIRGVTTTGLVNYIKQLALLKLIGHIKFAYIKLDIIKITMHPDDATVKVRWRIRGVTGIKMLLLFWKYKIWKIKDAIGRDQEIWYDGFSTFYVNNKGKIYKHVADKVMPDQDVVEKKEDLRIAPKLALFTGLADLLGGDEDFFQLNSALKLYRSK